MLSYSNPPLPGNLFDFHPANNLYPNQYPIGPGYIHQGNIKCPDGYVGDWPYESLYPQGPKGFQESYRGPGKRVYVIGALKNPNVVCVANAIEKEHHEVFADWYSPGPEADEFWRQYEHSRGRSYRDAISGPHAKNVFEFDKKWLDWATDVVLVLPAGRSGHLELGYAIGSGKRGYVLFEGEPERWDVMYAFAERVVFNLEELLEALG